VSAKHDNLAERLEAAIETARLRLIAAHTREERIKAWTDMRCLIGSRGPLTVLAMERAKGLRQ